MSTGMGVKIPPFLSKSPLPVQAEAPMLKQHVADMSCGHNTCVGDSMFKLKKQLLYCQYWQNVVDMSANVLSFRHSSRHEMSPCCRHEHWRLATCRRHDTSCRQKRKNRNDIISAKLFTVHSIISPFPSSSYLWPNTSSRLHRPLKPSPLHRRHHPWCLFFLASTIVTGSAGSCKNSAMNIFCLPVDTDSFNFLVDVYHMI